MKNKSKRHKETNIFKFQKFGERIANVDIDIFHRVEHENEAQFEEIQCYFYQTVQKWDILNLTEGYEAFRKEVKPQGVVTLAQLLYKKDFVVETLIKHIQLKNSLCLQPLLDLIVALAKDLEKDFYPYYPRFLDVLLVLLNTKDVELLEWLFTTLAYLFKFLWRCLTKDINVVLQSLLPLLSDNKPEYINNFASESFAFVARKVKDRRAFLSLILRSLQDNPDSINGCGRLLFEVLHSGIKGQFHSCAETMLPFLLDGLGDENSSTPLLFELLEQVALCVFANIQPEHGGLFLKTCIATLEKLQDKWESNRTENTVNHMNYILKLIGQIVEFKNGKFLKETKPLIDATLKLILLENLPESVLMIISQINILLLTSKNIRLSQEQASSIIRKTLVVENESVFLYFVEHVAEITSFEPLVLPTFLRYCVKVNLSTQCIRTLTSLIIKKSPLSGSGTNVLNWKKYPINFGSSEENLIVENILTSFLDNKTVKDIVQNADNYVCSLVILPHLNLCCNDETLKKINDNVDLLCKSIVEHKDVKKILFLLLMSIECGVHVPEFSKLIDGNVFIDLILPFCMNISYVCALRVLDVFLTISSNESKIISMDVLLKLHGILEVNFNSAYHELRLLTAHIYSLFENIPELNPSSDNTEKWKIFSMCYDVESISPQVQTYRDQIQILERFSFEKTQISLCKNTPFAAVPIRYLCGVLFMNFRLLWDPTIKIISSHAQGTEVNIFWNVFVEQLKNASKNVKFPPVIQDGSFESSCDFLTRTYKEFYQLEMVPDYFNYRLLLWKAMVLFPDVAESKTRDVSELFLTFVEEEYMKTNSAVAADWNIKQNAVIHELVETDANDKSDPETEEIKKELKKYPIEKFGGKQKLKTLIQHLQVFSKIKSPKSMYREPELNKLYLELLSHKNPEVQKLALDCIMTYKHKYLTPYQQNLYNLIDENNFKNELALFHINKDGSTVQEEHRENLIPVILNIVSSKMFSKTGLRTGGKSSGQLRRNLVLRFVAGCHENEMVSFMKMAFKFYAKYLEDDPDRMVENICNGIDLEKYVPPKRLQSSLNLLAVIVDKFGGLMSDELLKFVLNNALVVGAIIKGALRQVDQVHAGYLGTLRNLRVSCVKLIERFFNNFNHYPWTCVEISAVFNAFVWPYLDKLENEGIHSPTALLKLFLTWGSHPKYFCLLVRHLSDNTGQYPLQHIIKLLIHPKAHPSVTGSIMEMIEKLLTLQCDEQEQDLKTVIDNELPLSVDILKCLNINENLNYGSCILLPHIPDVLEKVKQKLNAKTKNISQRELSILSRMSELVWQADLSDKILQLLLPLALKRCGLTVAEDTSLKFTTTIYNLMQNVAEPQAHLKMLSPLFGDISHASSRKILCQILDLMAKKTNDEALKVTSSVVAELNAYDTKWLDQPDFQRRLDSFKQIQNYLDSNSVNIELGVLIMYNCFHIIRNENDISLKENASHCWKSIACNLIKICGNNYNLLNYILNDILFVIVKMGIKNKNDEIRHECISLLGYLARECPDAHVILRDLNKLTNKADLEVDFFENLTHLQLHRRARALLRFCQIFKQEIVPPNPKTLIQFVLPFASQYLCNEKYANKNSIVDSAIETVGIVCKLLPWHQYESVLKFYLGKLKRHKVEHQKQLVRVVVTVLDAFHFDLHKGHVNDSVKKVDEENSEEIEKEVASINETQLEADLNDESEIQDEEINEDDLEAIIEDQDNPEDEENVMEEDDDDVLSEQVNSDIKAVEKVQVLCKSTATRVIYTIRVVLLPQLHSTLAEMTHYEGSHKVNRKKTSIEREEEDMSRVPISLAFVKLLQRLPKVILDSNLPGIFMKMCTFLKSQLESVRRIARETFQKIMLTLGPSYLHLLLTEITPLLSRGFEVHVLVYTVHSVLLSLKEMYKPSDIDKVLLTVVELCKTDLFGTTADEKEIVKIGRKISEAKSTKSFDTFQILAQYITETCLLDLVKPIKQVLIASQSFKVVHKAQDCLRHIALGLVENRFISSESLLTFSYGIVSEKIPELVAGKDKPHLTEKEREKLERQKSDCFIITPAPVGRSGYRLSNTKKSNKANVHVIFEFGLKICHFLLKRENLNDELHKSFLDPFVAIFKNCLSSSHVKLITTTLQCLTFLMKYDLPSLKENIKDITESMFSTLHKYAAAGLSKGDNFDLVVAAFKAMSVIVRDVKCHVIETDQLKILLLYVEQDLYNHDRQATAFGLLKAIISRKLIVPEIHEVMSKVAELSVTSELMHVRVQCRTVFLQFIMEYPLGNKLERHVAFYLSQLSYELQSGRESALEMIKSFINAFPMGVLKEHSGLLFITLGARLVNDEVPECRKMVAECLTSMLTRLSKPDRDPLFDILVLWFKDKKVSHKRLAAQLCGIMVNVEKVSFETRIPDLMPVILSQFGINEDNNMPGRFVLLKPQPSESTEENDEKDRIRDHHLFQVLQMLLKICGHCPSFLKHHKDIESLAEHIQKLLAHPHEWVRLAAAQFIGFVLFSLDIEHLADLLTSNKTEEVGYLCKDPLNGVKFLTLDLCAQLQPGSIKSDLAEQVIKNLVFMARVLQKLPISHIGNNKINLLWLAKRMRKVVNTEIVEAPSNIILRTEVFKWIAAVGSVVEIDNLMPVLHHLLAPLVREMITTEESNAPLRQLSKEVGNILKKRIGLEKYTDVLSRLQQHLAVKRSERKRSRNQLAVTDPEMYAKKKIKRHEKKKDSKKRKIKQKKGVWKSKKRKIDLEDNSDVM